MDQIDDEVLVKPSIEQILAKFTDDQKADLVIHSFVVAAGTINAQAAHGWWLGSQYGISADDALDMVKLAAKSCGEEGKAKILKNAGQAHPEEMKRVVTDHKAYSTHSGNLKDVLWREVLHQIPNDFSVGFTNEHFLEKLRSVKLDVNNPDFSPDSPNVGMLKKILAQEGYYNDKAWYKVLPVTHPLKANS